VLELSLKRGGIRRLISENESFNDPIELKEAYRLSYVMYWLRGFQRRNLLQLQEKMSQNGFSKKMRKTVTISFAKFKLACAIRPKYKQFFVWVFKEYLTPDRQEIFKEIRELALEDPPNRSEYYIRSMLDSKTQGAHFKECDLRLLAYFNEEDTDYWLPLSAFPLVEVDKEPKLKYAFLPYDLGDGGLVKTLREKVFNYLMKLDVPEILVPPSDVLFKIGNQKYNDAGVPRYDYERPTTFDSMFKYQRFLTQPLTPREVWLPGKAIKHNNTFFQNICRQFLRKDPTYPSEDVLETYSRIKDRLKPMLRFDISAFGIQYLREYLAIGASVIQEMYPSSQLDEQASILTEILSRVSVEMPDGTFVYPPRGIGLGYYEDLKTIVMLAILDDYDPVSVFGDQGLLPESSFMAIPTLIEHFFSIKFEKIEGVCSEPKYQTRWCGQSMSPERIKLTSRFMEPLIGGFFSRYHWERKLALLGVYNETPDLYRRSEKRICFMYGVIHGYEFFAGESFSSFENCGISSTRPTLNGYIKSWRVEHKMAPYSSQLFDVSYQTPFRTSLKKVYPTKIARAFQKERRAIYKSSPLIDNSVYLYVNPRLRYNKKDRPIHPGLPAWADLLYLSNYGLTTGSFTYGMSSEDIRAAAERQHLSSDPFRARATGGYSIRTPWRTSRGPSEEWLFVAEFLSTLDLRYLHYVKRNDLRQNESMMEDPLYQKDNLINFLVEKEASKRKRPSVESIPSSDSLVARILQDIPRKIAKGQLNDLSQLASLVRKEVGDIQEATVLDVSDHGQIEEEADDFYTQFIGDLEFSQL